MAANGQHEQGGWYGPSGWAALGVVAGGLLLATCIWPGPPRFRPPELPLFERVAWAAGMAVGAGVALASIRQGPPGGRRAAYLALAVSACGVGVVAFQLAEILLPFR